MALNRLLSMTDGILGIAMTLLVLNIDIPQDHDFSRRGLLSFVTQMEHDLFIYAASFFLIARYWVEHHLIFHYIRNLSRALVWLNFLFAFSITMLPFATKLKGTYERDVAVAVIFGAVHIACWLSLLSVWKYAASRSKLLERPLNPRTAQIITRRLLIGPAVILAAISVSYINVRLGTLAFLFVPMFYLLQPQIDFLSNADEDPEH